MKPTLLVLFLGALATRAEAQLTASDGPCDFPTWQKIIPFPAVLQVQVS